MQTTTKRMRLAVSLLAAGVIAPLAIAGAASASPHKASASGAAPVHGTIKGLATGDFAFLDALSVPTLNLVQLSIAQSASGVSNKGLQTKDSLQQNLLTTKSKVGKTAYGRGAGVSLNLGGKDGSVPQAQLVDAEATSPKPSSAHKDLLNLPLKPLASVDIQPDTAQANTTSRSNFCVLGNKPISQGVATVTNADVLPFAPTQTVLSADGTVRNTSEEQLVPNGAGSFGLNSMQMLETGGITLFKGVPGAAINIKVVNPLILQAIAGGVPGTSKVTFGSEDGKKDVLKITAGGKSVLLTVEDLLGTTGAVIPVIGKVAGNQTLHLLNIDIGGKPTIHTSANGQTTSAEADLVKVQVINKLGGPITTTIGGPLGALLQPIVGPIVNALDQVVAQLQPAIDALGLTKGVDLRVGHFEANSQVPAGGIKCGLPVTKKSNKDPVQAGDTFTVTITAKNPYKCVVKNVRIDDKITGTGGVTWSVGATNPKADSVSNSEVVWDNVGDIQPGGQKQVTVDITVGNDSTAGQMKDHSHVTGTCATGNGPGTANVKLGGDFTLHGPNVTPANAPKKQLPNTGSSPWLPIGGGLLLLTGLGLAVARRRSWV